jgi:hypothetical protein
MVYMCFDLQSLQDMNANRITEYKRIIASYSDCQRRVLPVVNTCLDNITAASEAMDPTKVCCGVFQMAMCLFRSVLPALSLPPTLSLPLSLSLFVIVHLQDNQQLVAESKTGFPIPGDVEFVEYMGKQAKKAGQHKKGKVYNMWYMEE